MVRHAKKRCGITMGAMQGRSISQRIKCPRDNCDAAFYFRCALSRHLIVDHKDEEGQMERHSFVTREAFMTWRREEEARSFSRYTKARSSRGGGSNSVSVEIFVCDIAPGEGQGDTCPSQMRVTTDSVSGAVEVVFLRVHSHSADVSNTRGRKIPAALQPRVVADLSSAVSAPRLAAHYSRHGIAENASQPLLLSTRQVESIRQRANQQHPRLDSDPLVSANQLLLRWRHLPTASAETQPRVLFHVHDGLVFRQHLLLPPQCNSDELAVLPFCSQGTESGVLEHLPREVTVMALQSPKQSTLLRRVASKCLLSVDTVHIIEEEGDWFVLALSVPVEVDGGPHVGHVVRAVPCAFLVSNHLSEEILQELLSSIITTSCPDSFSPPIIVTDTSNRGLAAARFVFGDKCSHRVSSWRTVHSWRRQLCLDTRCHAVARPLLARLMCLQLEPSRQRLAEQLRALMDQYDSICPQFVAGLRERYAAELRLPEWAFAYRPEEPNFDLATRADRLMFAEPFHLQFVLFFAQSHRRRRLDDLLHVIADVSGSVEKWSGSMLVLEQHSLATQLWQRCDVKEVANSSPRQFTVTCKDSPYTTASVDSSDIRLPSEEKSTKETEQTVTQSSVVCSCPTRCFRLCPHLLCAGLCGHIWTCACSKGVTGLCWHIHAVQMRVTRADLLSVYREESEIDSYVARSDASLKWVRQCMQEDVETSN